MTVVLDAGALIAVDRGDRAVGAMLRVLQQRAMPVVSSAAVVAQVWRGQARQANVARVLAGVDVRPLGPDDGRAVGELLARARTADVVDGHVALLVPQGGTVVTSDPSDLRALLRARQVPAHVVSV